MEIFEEITKAVECILSTHHYNYRNFEDSRRVYFVQSNFFVCYDAMSLFIYEHSMDEQLYSEFSRRLFKQYHSKFDDEDKKMRKEYETLLLFFDVHTEFEKSELRHIIRPDFDITTKNGERVGIEVTQLISEDDSVQNAIMRNCFGRNMSAEEIRNIASIKHGSKAQKYQYNEIGKTAYISGPPKTASTEYTLYAQKIATKLEKYKEIKAAYDRFIILCDGRYPIFVSRKYDTEQIMEETKMLHPEKYGAEVAVIRYSEQPRYGVMHHECDMYEV